MDWIEITIKIPVERLEETAAVAQMVSPNGLYIEDYSDLETGAREIAHIDLIDSELLQKDRASGLIHFYTAPGEIPAEACSYLEHRLKAAGIAYTLSTLGVRDDDWADGWKKYFKPAKIGERLLICPTWEQVDREGRTVLKIDPGAAFGTGTHATTRLCLKLLEKYLNPEGRFLDIGCGSGILSAAAALLGAGRVVGVDIDPVAVKTADENMAVNGIPAEKYEIFTGDLIQKVTGKFSLIAANIVADVIIALAPDIPRFLESDGVFICSGVIDRRSGDVEAALCAAGLCVREKAEDRGLIAFCCYTA
ncbi:MAG: 50S ribosomal protein L11 methyltransferase [Oscillospiraceae bacterium]|nr:50S ribosomal protein L11 methyltransferase [Oscillospiraceae bacterium]